MLILFTPCQNKCRAAPKESEMTAQQKYWVHSKRYRNEIKPAHWVPKWTKHRLPEIQQRALASLRFKCDAGLISRGGSWFFEERHVLPRAEQIANEAGVTDYLIKALEDCYSGNASEPATVAANAITILKQTVEVKPPDLRGIL
ncbi:hypothetical protein HDU67_004516 [Dinochytrium kinnereticum]|nr:hypothetical protein HDU67_004516 [Dinochytrium kinnereticum]